MDRDIGVRNAILLSDKVSKTQVIDQSNYLHFLLTHQLNKFSYSLLKGYVILSLACDKILPASKQKQKSPRHCQLLQI